MSRRPSILFDVSRGCLLAVSVVVAAAVITVGLSLVLMPPDPHSEFRGLDKDPAGYVEQVWTDYKNDFQR